MSELFLRSGCLLALYFCLFRALAHQFCRACRKAGVGPGFLHMGGSQAQFLMKTSRLQPFLLQTGNRNTNADLLRWPTSRLPVVLKPCQQKGVSQLGRHPIWLLGNASLILGHTRHPPLSKAMGATPISQALALQSANPRHKAAVHSQFEALRTRTREGRHAHGTKWSASEGTLAVNPRAPSCPSAPPAPQGLGKKDNEPKSSNGRN